MQRIGCIGDARAEKANRRQGDSVEVSMSRQLVSCQAGVG